MKRRLILWCSVVLLAMLVVTTWASLHENVGVAFLRLGQDPWGLATLMDAYFAFLVFWFWVAWRERRWTAGLLWLLAILALGNFAIVAYLLLALAPLPKDATVETLLARRTP